MHSVIKQTFYRAISYDSALEIRQGLVKDFDTPYHLFFQDIFHVHHMLHHHIVQPVKPEVDLFITVHVGDLCSELFMYKSIACTQ